MPQTFAQYLIEDILPTDIKVNQQVDKKYLSTLLSSVAEKHPDDYGRVVSNLKRLGDKLSTLEPFTIGMQEIVAPNKENRNKIINKYEALTHKEKDPIKLMGHLEGLQKELATNDLKDGIDDATMIVNSALQGKAAQMMKARTSPGVVKDYKGNISPFIFNKSYAEGVDPVHFWLGAAESRANLAQGQVSTSAPGELGKVIANIMNGAVVSTEDCGTNAGILLFTKDDDAVGRHLARPEGRFPKNTLLTSEVQKELLREGKERVLVRSPQTCEAAATSVCQMCMGLRNATGKLYKIGDNAGMISAGTLAEPLTQMSLSAKHSTSLAQVEDVSVLKGEKGFRKFTTMPKNYSNRKILCEVYGEVYRILPAPQGGKIITIKLDMGKPVPPKYIEHGAPTPNMKNFLDYYIQPSLKVAEGIEEKTEVFPAMPLSNGVENLQDVARLKNLGTLRSSAAQGIYDVYKNTGSKIARVHMELLARQANSYVRIEKAPAGFPFRRGEVVDYNKLIPEIGKMVKTSVPVKQATGKILGEATLDLSVGTELDAQCVKYLLENDVDTVKIISGLEVSAVAMPMTRVVNATDDWLSGLNHRNLKTQLKDAAATGKVSDLHSFKPIAAYAYGAEMRHGEDGKY